MIQNGCMLEGTFLTITLLKQFFNIFTFCPSLLIILSFHPVQFHMQLYDKIVACWREILDDILGFVYLFTFCPSLPD